MADVEQLIRRHLSGDREATAQIIRAFRPLAVDQAMRTCGDREVAQDAAQEALVQALKHVEGLKEVERFPQWLATIARNEGHRSRRRRAASLDR